MTLEGAVPVGPDAIVYVGLFLLALIVTISSAPERPATTWEIFVLRLSTGRFGRETTAVPPTTSGRFEIAARTPELPSVSVYFQCSSQVFTAFEVTTKMSATDVVLPCLVVTMPVKTSGCPTIAPPERSVC